MTKEQWDSYQNDVEIVNELTEYLLMAAKVDGQRHYLAYNKTNEDFFSISRPKKCDEKEGHGLTDDMIGTGPYWIWDGADLRNNSLVDQLDIVDLKELVETDCFRESNLITDQYRNELVKIVEESNIEDNPVIRILHLK